MSSIPVIRLSKYNWTSDNNIFVTGFIWLNGNYTTGKAFSELISQNTDSFEDLKRITHQWNGQFSFVVKKETELWAGCGHTWSYPLFYRTFKGKLFISDEPRNLSFDESSETIEPFSSLYFLNFGVTPSEYTLSKDVFQIQPGELIRSSGSNVWNNSFLPFFREKYADNDPVQETEFYRFLMLVFEKYYNEIKDKKVLLPLTRGYDSRLLACLLKEYGHRNVICITWGRPFNSELGTAEKVAGKLGFQHIFVDYSKIIANDFTSSNEFFAYVNYAGHWSSMPFLYEYFGLKELKEKEIIGKDTVALPGHPGDFLRGSHLLKEMQESNPESLISNILLKFGSSYSLNSHDKDTIKRYIGNNFFEKGEDFLWHKYELWDYKERQCKFIGNSTQVFPFFEIDYLMPLFDADLIRFFNKVPFVQKVEQELYNNTLEKYFFKKFGVDFDLKQVHHSRQQLNVFKDKLLGTVPRFLKKYYYPLNDDIYYREITDVLRSSNEAFHFKHPVRPNAYNSYIIQWYLQYFLNSACNS
ncbi:MAG TPA: hypothetical protein VLQ91_12425 [Draconibacterium sp.]|nr:hypothetical protein [Draconibacterium sp.]